MDTGGGKRSEVKRLIFVRHSNAESQVGQLSDFERSLTPQGKVNARIMAERLKARGWHPGKIISSPAFRALETALIFSRVHNIDPSLTELSTELYLNLEYSEFLPFITGHDESVHTITIFGHNPLITALAAYFAAGDPGMIQMAGICALEFDNGSWEGVKPSSGRILFHISPADEG